MSQPSMQFTPQWLKKPALAAASHAHPTQAHRTASPPLPLQQSQPAPRTATPPAINTGFSYSHMANPSSARSESFPGSEGGGGPYTNGHGHGGAHGIAMDEQRPFRYSKEAILALYDPAIVRTRPLELLELGEAGAVILSDKANGPVGLTDMTDEEKKIFHSSLNPPMRQRAAHPSGPASNDATHPAPYLRRGPTASISGTAALPGAPRGTIGGGFGRGEGGAFGGKAVDARGGPGAGAIGAGAGQADGEARERDSGYIRDRERSDRPERGYERDRERHAGTSGRGPGGGYIGAPEGEDGRRTGPLRRGMGSVRGVDGVESASPAPRAGNSASTWRPSIRNNSLSGASFEGVLGFGGGGAGGAATASTALAEQPQPQSRAYPSSAAAPSAGESPGSAAAGGWRERERVAAERERFSNAAAAQDRLGLGAAGVMPLSGGGSGWSKGGGRWRQAAQADQTPGATTPDPGHLSEGANGQSAETATQAAASVAAGPTGTPVEERMEQLCVDGESQNRNGTPDQKHAAQSIDPETVQWFYTDPQGLQQGPFTANQMQDWYSHSYFSDTLPLRRDHETDYRTLAAVKIETGDVDKPFLTRPLPPRQATPPAPVQTIAPPQVAPSPFQNAGFVNGMSGSMYPQQPIQQPAFDAFNQIPQPIQQQRSVWDNPALQARQSPFLANVAPIGSPFAQQGVPGYFGGVQAAIGGSQGFSMPQAPFQAVSPWGSIPQQAPQAMPHQDMQHVNAASAYQRVPQQAPSQVPDSLSGSVDAQHRASSPWAALEAAPAPSTPVQEEESIAPIPQTSEENQPSPQLASGAVKPSAPVASEAALGVSSPMTKTAEIAAEEQPSVTLPAKPVSTPAAKASALPPAPASLPPKPPAAASSPKVPSAAETKAAAAPESKPMKATKEVAEPTPASSPASKVAPWAAKEDEKSRAPSGPSLRDIQEAEAKQADARKQAESKAKAAAAAAQTVSTPQPDSDSLAGMSWGLPSKPNVGAATTSAASTPSDPVWGQGDAGSKKTLKQIQEEEEKRAKAQAAAKAATSGGAAAPTRRGYADLAAGPTQGAAGWSTVGSGGKTAPAPAQPARSASNIPAKPSVSLMKPATPTSSPAKATKASPGTLNEVTPTADFIRWTKESLTGLKGVNMDEFVQMLLTFPVEPASAERPSTLEIISDSVYANSSTLDGRRFAQEFYAKRKADAHAQLAAAANGKPITSSSSLADVVKAQPKTVNNDFGAFKIVKSKSKGRK